MCYCAGYINTAHYYVVCGRDRVFNVIIYFEYLKIEMQCVEAQRKYTHIKQQS